VAERVLVTGAAGFIGVPLVEELRRRGHEVVALDGPPGTGRGGPAPNDGRLDLRDSDATRRAVLDAAPCRIVHLAAVHFIPWCAAHPAETVAVNVLGTQHLLDAAAEAGCERLLLASTGDVYEPSERRHREDDRTAPINVYGASKLAAEQLVRLAPLEADVARLFNVYGPGETNPHVIPELFGQMRRGDVLRLGNTEARRDYVYLDDAVAALVAFCEREGPALVANVGTGVTESVDGLVRRLRRLTGRGLRVEVDRSRLRPSDRPVLCADRGRLGELLGTSELTPLDEGLRRTLVGCGVSER